MSGNESDDSKRGQGRTLSLRGSSNDSSRVRQSFSHGRSNVVVVEKVKKRVINPRDAAAQMKSPGQAEQAAKSAKSIAAAAGVTEEEYQRRLRALEGARIAEAERKQREAAEAARRAEEEARRQAEEIERKKRELEEARRRAEEEARAKAPPSVVDADDDEDEDDVPVARSASRRGPAAMERAASTPHQGPRMTAPPPKVVERSVERAAPAERTPAPTRAALRDVEKRSASPRPPKAVGDEKRRSGKITIEQALNAESGARQRSMAAMKRRQERDKRRMMGAGEREKVIRDVVIPEAITVQELANRMAERGGDVIKALMRMGVMATITQTIDADTAQLVAEEFGHRVQRVADADVEDVLVGEVDSAENMIPRAPVVTIMGHVDHGKTSLLDALRKTNVVSGEAGGITQHIGAYQVHTASGAVITFLDTPGHAAFTSMRARGAQVTDIVVLVVAADDSVMPQTIEAIAHAKAAKVPMIVAINKIDKHTADPNRVRQNLLQHEVFVEALGGDVLDVEVSAKTGKGLDKLLEAIMLQAEVMDLRANPNRPAEGAVIEAKLDVGRGPIATVLVQRGTLKQGDIFVVGEVWGRVRALMDDQGNRIERAGPAVPVEVLGLQGTPEAGDRLHVVEDENKAREIAAYRQRLAREKAAVLGARATLDQLLSQAKTDANVKELPVVIKGDVQGSVEAIVQALEKVGNAEVRVRVLHSGVGAITESDVTLADASRAPIIGFNVRANAPARDAAQQKGVEIRYYSIIYNLVDDVKKAASGLLSPEIKESFVGYARIKQVFKITGVGNVAGCDVIEGVARRNAGVRLLRDNVVIHEGKLKTLKRFKDEVKEVQAGQECGMAFERYEDIREGDVIEIFETIEVQRTL